MNILELILIAVGLSMDAFAVAVCKGLNMRTIDYKKALVIALFFGGFQAIMPLIGWLIGSAFGEYIMDFDHWVAFVLLGFIGGKMIWESAKRKDQPRSDCAKTDMRELLMLSFATSVDALAVGVTFAVTNTNIWLSVPLIGVITLALSFAGVVIGNKFGAKYKSRAEFAGGVILVGIGLKILLEHLGVFG